MYPDQFFALKQPIPARRSQRRILRHWKTIAAIVLVCAVSLAPARPALATVQTSGIVYAYFDDPALGLTYGLPFFGNDVDFFPGPPSNAATFEYDAVAGPAGTTLEDEIIVGKAARGDLVIAGASILRAEHLIIGDIGMVGDDDRGGTGIVRVTGFASTYNSNPDITALHPSVIGTSWTTTRVFDDGYDLWIGRGSTTGAQGGGNGTLEISAGGNVEIQDSAVVANDPGSRGTIIVDGIDSTLQSGGFDAQPTDSDPRRLIVGRRGIGTMTIRNGGTVLSEAPLGLSGGGADAVVGAAIGSDAFELTTPPDPGGEGIVTVTGPASDWIVGGSLQVGGFHNSSGGIMGGEDVSGEFAEYGTEAGNATLIVELGGQVTIRPTIDGTDMSELWLAIGHFGRLELNGGYVSIGNGLMDEARTSDVKLINDGVIIGAGRIDTGVFRNRYLGQVRVNAGESLLVAATSEFIEGDAFEDEPLVNFGLIEVTGEVQSRAELEFERSPGTITPPRPVRPFLNIPLPLSADPPSGFRGGVISAQHATLRFGSGVQNEGVMAFNAGTNIITGRVDNVATDQSNGRFFIGPDTTVIVEGDFSSGGLIDPMPVDNPILTIRPGGLLTVLDHDSFTMNGHLDMAISRTNPARIEVAGDVGLNGSLYMSFDNDTLGSLEHGDAFELIYFAGFIGGVDNTNPAAPVPDLTVNPVLNVVQDPILTALYPNLDFFTTRILQSFYLLVLDPSMVGGGGGAMGPDFNGDGVIDLADLAIWQANQGCQSGCSVLQGDADGDGDVDGDDLLFWQRNVGMPPPWTGAGSGSGGLGTNVPEPTGLVLVLSGGLLALACRRARHAAR